VCIVSATIKKVGVAQFHRRYFGIFSNGDTRTHPSCRAIVAPQPPSGGDLEVKCETPSLEKAPWVYVGALSQRPENF
jgi:hypothetical protein